MICPICLREIEQGQRVRRTGRPETPEVIAGYVHAACLEYEDETDPPWDEDDGD